MSLNKQEEGFTLVELLVVLAIIGVLVGLAIGGMRIVQQVNRDTQRKAFISKDVQIILEAHQDSRNRYPERLDVTEAGGAGNPCAQNETHIVTIDRNGDDVEEICSKVNFDVSGDTVLTSCDSFDPTADNTEQESGEVSFCYESDVKGYQLMMKLERSSDLYDASNVEV